MPTVHLVVTGTPVNLGTALASIANAITSAGGVIPGLLTVTVNVSVADFPSVANVQLQITVDVTVASRTVFTTLDTNLAAVKTANPGLSMTLTYQEQAII